MAELLAGDGRAELVLEAVAAPFRAAEPAAFDRRLRWLVPWAAASSASAMQSSYVPRQDPADVSVRGRRRPRSVRSGGRSTSGDPVRAACMAMVDPRRPAAAAGRGRRRGGRREPPGHVWSPAPSRAAPPSVSGCGVGKVQEPRAWSRAALPVPGAGQIGQRHLEHRQRRGGRRWPPGARVRRRPRAPARPRPRAGWEPRPERRRPAGGRRPSTVRECPAARRPRPVPPGRYPARSGGGVRPAARHRWP